MVDGEKKWERVAHNKEDLVWLPDDEEEDEEEEEEEDDEEEEVEVELEVEEIVEEFEVLSLFIFAISMAINDAIFVLFINSATLASKEDPA